MKKQITAKSVVSYISTFLILYLGITTISVSAQKTDLWTPVNSSILSRRPLVRTPTPKNYRSFKLDKQKLRELVATAPNDFLRSADKKEIELPMPDGKLARFRFEHSLVVEPGLLAKYPELGETYRGYGIDDPTATVRFDLLPNGFHAMILSSSGTVVVDPFAVGDTENYVTYTKSELVGVRDFKCEVGDSTLDSLLNADLLNAAKFIGDAAPSVIGGTELRTYRLALAASNEYAAAVGGNTVAGTLAAQVLIMNRVNGVYERDLAIHMNIVANNDLIIYAGDNMCAGVACTSSNDPYTNSSGSAMLSENTTNLNTVIQPANYDIGHVFSTGGGGVAALNGPCGSNKARGVTGLSNPVGDPFAIDYVAHEMGHQWGANHTFNGSVGSCSGNRSAASAYEPGSGVTIMGYAGICGNQDLARNSIDTFHVKSLEVIAAYSQTGNGNSCAVITPTGNTAPSVSIVGGTIFNIPKQTPFTMTASANDADGDLITYDWQQYDLGAAATTVPNTDETGVRPIFRSYDPTTSPSRTFPSLAHILNTFSVPPGSFGCGRTTPCLMGELLPQIGRTMTFQVVARDNRAGAGGVATATASVIVDGDSGPFAITSPNAVAVLNGQSQQVVMWNEAGTAASPISASNVRISLSTDGGITFPFVLAANTPNDGLENITLPNISTTTARIKIEAVGNIFFDISDANFAIVAVNVVPITVSGRVLSPTGIALRNVRVTMIDSVGVRRLATTSSTGNYSFEQVPMGDTYTMTVSTRRYRFAPKIVTASVGDIFNLNFTGLE